jgi:hypothetical protein
MGNQQERFDLRLAWLAGIIEGEGWISLGLVRSMKRNKSVLPAFVPQIGMVNTDLSIVDECERLFKELDIKYRSQLRPAYIHTDGAMRKEKKEISIATHVSFKKLSSAIYPYMIGEKRKRIEKILEFLKIRESKPRSGINSKYGQEEFDIYKSLYSYRGKSRSKILNDFTPNAQTIV